MFQVLGGSVELVAVSLDDKSDISSSHFMKIIRHLVFELTLHSDVVCEAEGEHAANATFMNSLPRL